MVVNKITGVTVAEHNLFLKSQCLRDYIEKVKNNYGEVQHILLFNIKRTEEQLHSAVAEVTLKYNDGEVQTRNVFFRGSSVVIIPYSYRANSLSLLMVRQNRIALGGLSLEFPAGGVEKNETPNQAARRELKEETGISANADKLVELGNGFIICESAFSETASWFVFSIDENQLEALQRRILGNKPNGEIVSLQLVKYEELLRRNTFQIHCGLSLLKNYLEKYYV